MAHDTKGPRFEKEVLKTLEGFPRKRSKAVCGHRYSRGSTQRLRGHPGH